MDKLITIFAWIGANYQSILSGVVGILSALIVVFAMIPGDQPEKTLQMIVDFIKKFSSKPSVK